MSLRISVTFGPIESRSDREMVGSARAAIAHRGDDGAYHFTGLQPGVYTIVAYTNTSRNPNVWLNTRATHQVIEVSEDGRTATVELRLP